MLNDYPYLKRFPRLIQAMQWVGCLSEGEATACIRDYLAGLAYSGEAVNHFGGTQPLIRRAAGQRARWIVADRRRDEARRLFVAYEIDRAVNGALASWYDRKD